MADILLSVGMQTGSAETSEFISKLSSIVNSINKSDSTEIKMRPVIDSAGFNELKAQLSTISSMVDQISQKKFDLTVNLDNSMEMKERLGAYQEQIREYVRNVQDAYSAIGQITKSGPIREMGTEANQYIAPALEAITQYGDALGKLETRLDKTSSMAGAERIAQDAQRMYTAIQPLIELARDKGVLSFGENDFRLPAMMSEAASSATGLGGILDSLISSIQSLSSAVAQIGTTAPAVSQRAAAGLKEQSTAANEAAQSTGRATAAYKELVRIQGEMGKVQIKLATETDTANVKNLLQELQELYAAYQKVFYSDSSNGMSSAQLAALAKGFDDIAQKAQVASEKAYKAAEQAEAKAQAAAEKRAAAEQAAAEKKAAAAQAAAEKKAAAEEAAAKKAREAAEREAEQEERLATRKAQAYKRVEAAIADVNNKLRSWSAAEGGKSDASYKDLQGLIDKYRELGEQLRNGKISLEEFNAKLAEYDTTKIKAGDAIKAAGENMKALGSGLNTLESRFVYMLSLSNVILQAVRQIKQMVKTTIELDSAMTQLRVVTNASESDYTNYGNAVAKTAQEIGASITDLIDSTTVFARLGYSLDESSSLAKYTAMLSNVGDIDVSSAQSALTAITKAYGISASEIESVMDKMVAVGNNFPISVAELAEGMNNAGSALAAAGNSFEQSVALLTAANTTIQNISKSSTGLRTITARIRGTKLELEELGEAIETAKYEEAIEILTKHKVALTDNGEFRATYDILQDIASVWKELSSMEQATIAEQLAGKMLLLPVRTEMCA